MRCSVGPPAVETTSSRDLVEGWAPDEAPLDVSDLLAQLREDMARTGWADF